MGVLVAIMMWMLITFTPLKQYIPGYSGGDENQELVAELTMKVEEMEAEMKKQEFYANNFRQMLIANVEREGDVHTEIEEYADSTLRMLPGEEEEGLRVEMQQMEEQTTGVIRTNQSPSKPLEQLHFIPPVSGEVSKGFNSDQKHFGIDLVAPTNTPIKAVLDGYVFFSDWTMDTGNVIGIQHANNTVSFYKHNSVLLKEAGSFVKAGEAVAVIGNTGMKTDGPHLHFELWHDGKAVDPAEYMSFL